ncbi:MAG: TolB family protein [Actinomycetota bacterium]
MAIQLAALAAPGDLTLVSTSDAGTKGNQYSIADDITSNGSKVVFTSAANNIDPLDPNSTGDVYVKDVASGDLTLVSVTADGTQPLGGDGGAISADGSRVAFVTSATIDAADTDIYPDVYVKDLADGSLTLASIDGDGTKAVRLSYNPSISADGTKVAFEGTLDPSNEAGKYDIYLKDLTTGLLSIASANGAGVVGNRTSYTPSLSADGLKVAFSSDASNLHPSDLDQDRDIFVKDAATGTITLASTDTSGIKANNSSSEPSLSADGASVAFVTGATNLDPADSDDFVDVYVKDLATGTLTFASTTASGIKANHGSIDPSLSGDGTKVAVASFASNLDERDTDHVPDVYVKDLVTGAVELASSSSAGTKGDGLSDRPHIADDATAVAFTSLSTNLDPADTDPIHDAYVKELAPVEPEPVSVDLKLKKQGFNYTVTILGSPDFDAVTLDVATVCFGDAEEPGQHDCTELDGAGVVKDVDRDKDADVTLQFEAAQTGIDAGDTQACLTAETMDGIPIEGCGAIPVKKR